jgi:hypothetical protein
MADTPIDLWCDNFGFGKFDNQGYPAYVTERVLKQIPSDKGDIFAQNFVVDAWGSVEEYVRRRFESGMTERKNSVYADLQLSQGWLNHKMVYHQWVQFLYEMFFTGLRNSRTSRSKITTFKTFLNLFVTFIDSKYPRIPFTRTAWYVGPLCPIQSSGLILSVGSDQSHSDDSLKYKYLNDKMFPDVVRAAQRAGFKINKNAPWTFVADMESPAMMTRMKQYNFDKKNIYDKAYYRTYENELFTFIYYVWSWYSSYSLFDPITEVVEECRGTPKTRLGKKEKISFEEAFNAIHPDKWIRLYVYTLAKDKNKKWNQGGFEKVYKRVRDLAQYKDVNRAMKYLFDRVYDDRQMEELYLKERLTIEEKDAIMKKNISEGYNGKGTFSF